jgi:hypothetical protein
METPTMIRRCACCGQPFQPRPQVPNQTYCSSAECQRARKLRWQQDKLRNDAHYRENQHDAQRAWRNRNPGYLRAYRASKRDSLKPSRKPAANGAGNGSAKMDVSILPSGLYRLRKISPSFPVRDGGWLVEITHLCATCPCKKDV